MGNSYSPPHSHMLVFFTLQVWMTGPACILSHFMIFTIYYICRNRTLIILCLKCFHRLLRLPEIFIWLNSSTSKEWVCLLTVLQEVAKIINSWNDSSLKSFFISLSTELSGCLKKHLCLSRSFFHKITLPYQGICILIVMLPVSKC
jgi:hypothetical protein